MSNFLIVLGVSILILGLLFFFYGEWTSPTERYITVEEMPEITEEYEVGWVGVAEQELKHVPIGRGFKVSYMQQEEVIFDGKEITVSSGVLSSKDKKIYFSAGEVESAKISFSVKDTNLYGPLMLVLNNIIIYQNASLVGKYEISFNKSLLKSENVLEIKAGSSGWRFWAPTVYILDLKLILGHLSLKTKAFSVTLGDEALALTKARFYADAEKKGIGNLIVRVNGEEIYRGNESSVLKDFSFEILKPGENTVEFLTERNTEYDIKEAEFIIFYQPVYKTKTFWYNMSKSDYQSLLNKNLTLKFYVKRIAGDVVSIPIKITDGRGFTHTIIPQGILRENQWYSVILTKNELYTGSNKIEFSVDKGGILITNITVG